MTNPTDTAEEAAREWYADNVRRLINWSEDDEQKASALTALLRERERAGIERAAKESERHSEAQYEMIEKNPKDADFHNFAGGILETNAALIRALLTKEGT